VLVGIDAVNVMAAYQPVVQACCEPHACTTGWYAWVYCEWTPDDGQRNSPKHVEFHAKINLWKLAHLVGFIIKETMVMLTSHGTPLRTGVLRYSICPKKTRVPLDQYLLNFWTYLLHELRSGDWVVYPNPWTWNCVEGSVSASKMKNKRFGADAKVHRA
jgi:hypothetical protein